MLNHGGMVLGNGDAWQQLWTMWTTIHMGRRVTRDWKMLQNPEIYKYKLSLTLTLHGNY
jgi:hypothetical protein